ncbi:MAG: DUF4118 domain-containing protein [Oscillospiraceae bacterium]
MTKITRQKIKKAFVTIFTSGFFITTVALTVATLIAQLIKLFAAEFTYTPFVFILAVVAIANYTKGYLWGSIASLASVLLSNYYFIKPYNQFDFKAAGSSIMFVFILLVSLLVSTATTYIKEQAFHARLREEETNRLNQVGQDLLKSNSRSEVIQVAIDSIQSILKTPIAFFGGEILTSDCEHYCTSDTYNEIFLSETEFEVIRWVYDNKKTAGYKQRYFPNAQGKYTPVTSHGEYRGIIGILCVNNKVIDQEVMVYAQMVISQMALALERQYLADKKNEIAIQAEKEKMRSTLLSAVSHDLRTPLTSISGACVTILDNYQTLQVERKVEMLQHIDHDAKWLIRMVENLLSVTRISNNAQGIKKTDEFLEEVLSEAVVRVKSTFKKIKITAKIPDEILVVPMDATLIEQVIINLCENAIKHSGKQIDDLILNLVVTSDEKFAKISIVDNGYGIRNEDDDLDFTQLQEKQIEDNDKLSRNMGIGLSICSTIINAHNGKITTCNNESGGATVSFVLPLANQDNMQDIEE